MQDNKYFDYKLLGEKNSKIAVSDKWMSAYLVKQFRKISSLDEDLVQLPNSGQVFYINSDGFIDAFSFIPLIAKAYPLKELHATVSNVSLMVIDALLELHSKGLIEMMTLQLSTVLEVNNPAAYEKLTALSKSNIKIIRGIETNARLCLMKTHHQGHFVVEGSGLWDNTQKYEQYTLTNSEEVYNFRLQLLNIR